MDNIKDNIKDNTKDNTKDNITSLSIESMAEYEDDKKYDNKEEYKILKERNYFLIVFIIHLKTLY